MNLEIYIVLTVLTGLTVICEEIKPTPVQANLTTTTVTATTKNETANTTTETVTSPSIASPNWFNNVNSGAAMRTFYVIAFLTASVVIYFVVRAVRLRRRKSKSRKYGVITSSSAMEMEPLEKGEDDDDEDTTLFDVHQHNKYGQK